LPASGNQESGFDATGKACMGSTGGKGRKELILYDVTDPLTVTWARLCVERRGFVSCGEALDLTWGAVGSFSHAGNGKHECSLLKVRRSKPASVFGGRNQTP
jgi:hypothetical protein